MVRTMGSTTRAMARANALQRPQDVAATMRQYEMQRERMDAARIGKSVVRVNMPKPVAEGDMLFGQVRNHLR